jgi:hypothetical protein
MGKNTNYFKDNRDDLTGIVIPLGLTVHPQWYRPKQNQTIQWSKEKEQIDKQWSKKTYK